MTEKYLDKKVEYYDPININSVEEALNALKNCGFQGRNLGSALDLLDKIESDDECLKVLTLSGALTPAGLGEIIRVLIERKLIDVIISTGANITHDLVNAFVSEGHYLGSPNVDDNDLYKHRINRIFDIYLPEENYRYTKDKLHLILDKIMKNVPKDITPSKFYNLVGKNIDKRCILSLAAKYNVPVFIPANTDSEIALDFITYQLKEKIKIPLNDLEDIIEFAKIITNSKYKRYAIIIIGGGVPRNWAQQIFPLLDQISEMFPNEKLRELSLHVPCPECNGKDTNCILCNGSGRINRRFKGYDYSIRIHTAVEYDGGLSGCTITESKSWGKYASDAKHVSVWCDATIAFPLLITGYLQRIKRKKNSKY
jgi:deoxyhypusine synthase